MGEATPEHSLSNWMRDRARMRVGQGGGSNRDLVACGPPLIAEKRLTSWSRRPGSRRCDVEKSYDILQHGRFFETS
jgi:hypothetical protein